MRFLIFSTLCLFFVFWPLTFLELHLEGKLLWCWLSVLKNFNLVLHHSSFSIFGSLILFIYFPSIILSSSLNFISGTYFASFVKKEFRKKSDSRKLLSFEAYSVEPWNKLTWNLEFSSLLTSCWISNTWAECLQTCANWLLHFLLIRFLLESPWLYLVLLWLHFLGKWCIIIIIIQNRQGY